MIAGADRVTGRFRLSSQAVNLLGKVQPLAVPRLLVAQAHALRGPVDLVELAAAVNRFGDRTDQMPRPIEVLRPHLEHPPPRVRRALVRVSAVPCYLGSFRARASISKIRPGVTGSSRIVIPNSASASSMALAMAGPGAIAPLSPTPLTPSSLMTDG